jgi:chaperonin GroEL (HSP60 family)
MPTSIENAKIACLDFNLNKFRMKMGVQVLVDDPKNLEKIRQRELDILKESFIVSASVDKTTAEAYFSANKRMYVGSHHTNFTGSAVVGNDSKQQLSDLQIGTVRYWLNYIPEDILIKFVNTNLDGEELEMISGMCFKRTYPFQPCFYTKARINTETKKQ